MTINDECEVRFALWQESVLSDRDASGEDDFILANLTHSDFIE